MPACIEFGCNSACLEVVDEVSGAVLILDAGSGLAGVDLDTYRDARAISVLLSHYHWDHVLGLPFFSALYAPGRAITLYAPAIPAHDPRWLETVFAAPFFTIPLQQLPNRPAVQMVEPGAVAIPGFDVTAAALHHPGGALAYRIRTPRGDFVYATDHEFGNAAVDGPLAAFAQGAAAMVLDAHFTPEELPSHRGWGHSDWSQCAAFAAQHDIGTLWLFHHKPGRTDADLRAIRRSARELFSNTEIAAEGIECW